MENSSRIYKYSYLLFLIFSLTRPISIMNTGVPFILDLYAIVFGYTFLIIFLIFFNKIDIDRTTLLIIVFILYCTMSLSWRNDLREFAKLTIPFLFYFSSRIIVCKEKQIDSFLWLHAIGFVTPIILSTIFIILGINIEMVEWVSKAVRHAGAYGDSHTLAYQMLIFSFIFAYIIFLNDSFVNFKKSFFIFIFILTLFCLYKSHTRTAIVGFVTFWLIFFYGFRRKYFTFALIALGIIGIVYGSFIVKIFLKDTTQFNAKVATSGRTLIWEKYLNEFLISSVPEKILGKGIGWTLPGPGFHNDWLRLLMQNGIFGLVLFLFIMFSILYDIYLCKNKKIRSFFGAILLSMMIIACGSNNLISFFELSIIFWIMISFFYNLNRIKLKNEKES